MPLSPEFCLVTFNQFLQACKFCPGEPLALLESHWVQPELRRRGITLDMDMNGFVAIAGVKMESVRSDDLNRWHDFRLVRSPVEVNGGARERRRPD
jgi:hypothetical protein